MGRTERITITAIGIGIGVAILVLLWSLWALVNDVRNTISSVDGAVRGIAEVQGVQETVLDQLDALSGLGSDEDAPMDAAPADPGTIAPGRPNVSARQLWDDFDANQVRAIETYIEPKVWAVSGTVDSVQYGERGYIFVGLDGLVRVGFRENYERVWLDEIDKGQHLWFECEVRPAQDFTQQYVSEDRYLSDDGYMYCISPND